MNGCRLNDLFQDIFRLKYTIFVEKNFGGYKGDINMKRKILTKVVACVILLVMVSVNAYANFPYTSVYDSRNWSTNSYSETLDHSSVGGVKPTLTCVLTWPGFSETTYTTTSNDTEIFAYIYVRDDSGTTHYKGAFHNHVLGLTYAKANVNPVFFQPTYAIHYGTSEKYNSYTRLNMSKQ